MTETHSHMTGPMKHSPSFQAPACFAPHSGAPAQLPSLFTANCLSEIWEKGIYLPISQSPGLPCTHSCISDPSYELTEFIVPHTPISYSFRHYLGTTFYIPSITHRSGIQPWTQCDKTLASKKKPYSNLNTKHSKWWKLKYDNNFHPSN